jgi:cation:H+ antiporter
MPVFSPGANCYPHWSLTMLDWLLLAIGALLLYFGAEWFVGGASALALAMRIPQIIVGLTIVSYGTSMPEAVVGIEAAHSGHGIIALGNVIGSNIANIGLILGLAAIVRPAKVDGALGRRELPVLLISALAVPICLIDGVVGRNEALALIAAALIYTAWMIRPHFGLLLARLQQRNSVTQEPGSEVENKDAETLGSDEQPKLMRSLRSASIAVVGLGVLLAGGSLFVDSAVSIAEDLGLSARLVGLTIVALGTSLPELVTSMVAARRGHSDLAVGNVVGSNIFNVLVCLGGAALAGEVASPLNRLAFELSALILITILGVVLIRSERTISRLEGGIALCAFLIFLVFTILRDG